MRKQPGKYDKLSAGDLGRLTRERGLAKPDVLDIGEWARWLEAQDAAQSQPKPETAEEENYSGESDYSTLSAKELRAEAETRGIDTKALRTKTELIDALEAADGMTEDEQAEKYGDESSEDDSAS